MDQKRRLPKQLEDLFILCNLGALKLKLSVDFIFAYDIIGIDRTRVSDGSEDLLFILEPMPLFE